ncbi:hypothetical protein MKX01_005047, partial [Papaver californicum]
LIRTNQLPVVLQCDPQVLSEARAYIMECVYVFSCISFVANLLFLGPCSCVCCDILLTIDILCGIRVLSLNKLLLLQKECNLIGDFMSDSPLPYFCSGTGYQRLQQCNSVTGINHTYSINK